MNQKKVDVIIPTYKPDGTLRLLLKRLAAQDYPIAKIHIMNTEEKYWNPDFERGIDNIRVLHLGKQEFDHGGTRDKAARMSDADILVYLTQDAIPRGAKMISSLVRSLEQPGVAAAYGRQLPRPECDVIERYTRSFNYPPESRIKGQEDLNELGIKTYFCSNVCAAYDRNTYMELGGFVSHTIFNEDMIFAAKLIRSGYKIAYTAEARIIHSHNYGNIQQIKRNFDLAVSQTDHPEIFKGVKSEGEGIRLVKQTAVHLLKTGKPWLVFSLGISSICKYTGYLLGKNYDRLPRQVIQKLTMNPAYWG